MPRPRRVPGVFFLVLGLVGAGSCSQDLDDRPAVPARPGATQQGGGGKLLSEDEACDRIREVEEDVRRDLNCPDLERPKCPDYVRVAGSGCWRYPEESVEACERIVGAYDSCADFDDAPCVLTAEPADPSECGGTSTGGTGGSGGMGAAGESSGGESTGGRGGSATAGVGPGGAGGEGGEGGDGSGGEGGR